MKKKKVILEKMEKLQALKNRKAQLLKDLGAPQANTIGESPPGQPPRRK